MKTPNQVKREIREAEQLENRLGQMEVDAIAGALTAVQALNWLVNESGSGLDAVYAYNQNTTPQDLLYSILPEEERNQPADLLDVAYFNGTEQRRGTLSSMTVNRLRHEERASKEKRLELMAALLHYQGKTLAADLIQLGIDAENLDQWTASMANASHTGHALKDNLDNWTPVPSQEVGT